MALQRLFELGERGASGQEDTDVLQPGRSPALAFFTVQAVAHRPALAHRGQDGLGHLLGFRFSQAAGTGCFGMLPVEHRHRRPVRGLPSNGLEGLIVGLDVLLRGTGRGHELFEQGIDPIQDGLDRPEIAGERLSIHGSGLSCLGVEGDVGSAEPVDRLLGIAHEEEPPRLVPQLGPVSVVARGRGDELGQFNLNGVGVLELVEQQALVATGQCFSDLLAVLRVPQQVPGQNQ